MEKLQSLKSEIKKISNSSQSVICDLESLKKHIKQAVSSEKYNILIFESMIVLYSMGQRKMIRLCLEDLEGITIIKLLKLMEDIPPLGVSNISQESSNRNIWMNECLWYLATRYRNTTSIHEICKDLNIDMMLDENNENSLFFKLKGMIKISQSVMENSLKNLDSVTNES
ncbi:hypothetical protein ACR3K2_15540 [Cryptosporidium serpentis]